MKRTLLVFQAALGLALMLILGGCAEEGQTGSRPLNCGAHGTAHDGHCHCDSGYLYYRETCTTPDQISEICVEAAADAGVDQALGACLCPAQDPCPCDHGQLEAYGNNQYCVPGLDHE